jgi:sugar phosphate isomerase/epimerase
MVRAIRHLEGTIYHFRAKDTPRPSEHADERVLDTVPYDQVEKRSWVFRQVGYGHGELEWKQIVSALRAFGYDHVISVEHEDALTSPDEGIKKAISVLKMQLCLNRLSNLGGQVKTKKSSTLGSRWCAKRTPHVFTRALFKI